ncbi:hypothetical protein [Acinetobacter sp. WZC-1]|uniref:hypothetical protein n=1 Tax=Acinetobacter sp. WZC-1 TaxID=3459034 RepID=UPI00403DBCC7
MLYVIPFVLLLVVAIILKKREDASKGSSPEKTRKTNGKKTTRKTAVRPTRTPRAPQPQNSNVVVEDQTIIASKTTTPLTAEFKQKIEQLIHEKNYFSAEARINQSLNQDNSQHELYLYLLDIHLAHKDEFAVNQLLNHIRSLALNDILVQAEARKKAYDEQHQTAQTDAIEFKPESATAQPDRQFRSNAAFDALVNAPDIQHQQNSAQPFPGEPASLKLTAETAPDRSQELAQSEPLATTVQNPDIQSADVQDLNTQNLSIQTPGIQNPASPQVNTENTVQPLEFNFSFEKTVPDTTPAAADETTTVADPQSPVIPPLEFSFELSPKEDTTDKPPELIEPAVAETATDETATMTDIPAAVPLTLQLEPLQQVETTSADSTDPLPAIFPELLQVNEIQLNLELAEQYIALGAFDSARQLLSQSPQLYSDEQRRQSQNLLNLIAS